tara:strand:+ start:84 stop:212 length:129 start_codon:yes stop_codon:yes gene_type:complete
MNKIKQIVSAFFDVLKKDRDVAKEINRVGLAQFMKNKKSPTY